MRSLKKNQSDLFYALYSDQITIYERDENGDIIYDEIDGERYPRIKSERAGYGEPVPLSANISMSGGESEAREFGVDKTDYQAVIVTTKQDLPISETSIVWWKSPIVEDDDGVVDGNSADFRVIAVRPSLNEVKYLLKEIAKGG